MTDLLVDALAVFRLTRLMVVDAVVDEQRARALLWLEANDHPKIMYLLGCPWCVSPYIAAAVVVARRACPRQWDPVARLLAFSAAAGVLHALTTHDE